MSPTVKSLLYSLETATIVAALGFLVTLYGALSSPAGLDGFNWSAQVHLLLLALLSGVTKALIDFGKALLTKAPAAPTGGPNGPTAN